MTIANFLQAQVDYLYFLYSLIFIWLAIIVYLIEKSKPGQALSWRYLWIFAFIYGINQWISLLSLTFHHNPLFFSAIRLSLITASFLCLIEFGRINSGLIFAKKIGKWIFAPFLCLAALGALRGLTGLETASRYFLGLVGGVWAGLVLFKCAEKVEKKCLYLKISSLGLIGHALCIPILAASGKFFPVTFINQQSFLKAFGFPVQLLIAFFITAVTLSLRIYYQKIYSQIAPPVSKKVSGIYFTRVAALFFAILIFGWVLTELNGKDAEKSMHNSLLSRTKTLSIMLDSALIEKLSGTAADKETFEFKTLKRMLVQVKNVNPDCRFVYLMGYKDGNLIFLVDAEKEDSADYSPPGEVYEPSAGLDNLFKAGDAFTEGPLKDKWGTWVSSDVAIRSRESGEIIALAGVDIDAGEWLHVIAYRRLLIISILMLVALLSLGFLLRQQKLRELMARMRASEEYYRSIIDNAQDVIFTLSPEGVFTSLNPAFERIIGWPRKEWVGKPFADLVYPGDLGRAKELFISALSGESLSFQMRILSKSQEPIEAEFSVVPQIKQGKFVDILGIARDLSKRSFAEKRVICLNRLYTVVTKMDKVILRAESEEQIFQEACQILVSQGAFLMAWIGLVEPDNLNVTVVTSCGYEEGYLGKIHITLADAPQGHGPTSTALREGKYSVCNDIKNDPRMAPWRDEAIKRGYNSSAAFPFKIGGRTMGVINVYSAELHFFNEEEISLLFGLADDISFALTAIQKEDLRKRVETERDRFFNFSVDMLGISGFDGYFKQLNPAFERVLGWSKDELLSKPFLDFVHPDDRKNTIKEHRDLLEGRVIISFENRYLCKDGSYKWISWNSFPLIEGREVFSVARDITKEKQAIDEIKNAYVKLKDAQNQLVQANKMQVIGTLASGVAHEVRNPLAIILQGVNFLEKNIKPAEEKEQNVVGMIKEAVIRADNIIRSLFDFTRPAELKLKAVDINEIAKVSIGLIEKQVSLRNIDIKQEFTAGLPLVLADKNQMEQVFVNIIANAIQAMPEGGVLTLRTFSQDYAQLTDGIDKRVKDVFSSSDKAIICEIEDTGLGISEDNRRRLFEPFFTTKPPGQGLGLGLGIAKTIIDNHKGLISIESNEGKGTKVTITLPLAKNA